MSELPKCIKCGSEFTYLDVSLYVCPECGHEWSGDDGEIEDESVKDSNGNVLVNGNSFIV